MMAALPGLVGSSGDEEEEIQDISVTDRFTEGSIMY